MVKNMGANQRFLKPIPPQPAIRNAMAKVAEREDNGLPIIDFTSGNVGKLPHYLRLFSKMEIEVNKTLPDELQNLSTSIRRGLNTSFNSNPLALAYSPAGGTNSIKRCVLRYFREVHGVPLTDEDMKRVIVTSGGQRCITVSLRSLKPSTKVFMNRWDYSAIAPIVKEHGGEVIRFNCKEDLSPDLTDLEEKMEDEAVLYLSMPNNPSGYVSASDLEHVVSLMTSRDGGVIWDAPYVFTILKLWKDKAEFDIRFAESMLTAFQRTSKRYYDKLCILSSLSKTCLLAGLRVGFATASTRWIQNMSSLIGREDLSSPTSSFIIGESVLQRFLEDHSINHWLCKIMANRLTLLMEEKLPLILPQNGVFGALYALLDTGKEDGVVVSERLLDQSGIAVVPGEPFYGGPVNAVRLSLVASPWMKGDEEWVKNVQRLKKVLYTMGLI
jgi:aspartate/methionine/tyrosine aminotransferase